MATVSLQPAGPPESPAREERYNVVDRWDQCANFADDDPRKVLEFLHRQMNEEMDATECSARTITDFPEAPWEVRMFLARQCADEARHAYIFARMFEKRGGKLGEFPILNFQYRIICQIPTLIGRLAVQNRTFEAEGIDAIGYGIDEARVQGDDELAEFFDGQFADEIMHVRCANEFIHEILGKDARQAMKVAQALTFAVNAFGKVVGGDGTAVAKYTISETGRLEAGFNPEEVKVASRLAEDRRDNALARKNA
jgi:uncharacterized ferritin-like protein (DUF455 family)